MSLHLNATSILSFSIFPALYMKCFVYSWEFAGILQVGRSQVAVYMQDIWKPPLEFTFVCFVEFPLAFMGKCSDGGFVGGGEKAHHSSILIGLQLLSLVTSWTQHTILFVPKCFCASLPHMGAAPAITVGVAWACLVA
jgi:hypothetical protein